MRSFFSWWFSQLAGLLPDIVKRASNQPADAAILEIDSAAISLLIRSRGVTAFAAQSSADEAGMGELAQALTAMSQKPPHLVLRLPSGQVLEKHLSLPLAARRDLRNVLGFEIDRETPFAREEIYWSHVLRKQDTVRGRLDVELFIVPRSLADPFIELARRAGLDPISIEVETGGGGTALIPFKVEKSAARFVRERPLVPLAASAGAIALIGIAAPFLYQEWAIASADATIASLEAQAREALALRQSADRLTQTSAFLKQHSARNGGALATLAAVTRALPDDSYLTALNLHGDRLTMSGLSPAAADLVGVFAHLPAFREPAFDSPVVESENGDLESFTISVTLAQARAP